VELGIVATLREVVLRGVTELAWQQVAALTLFLLALGALLRFGNLRMTDTMNGNHGYLSQFRQAEGLRCLDDGVLENSPSSTRELCISRT
jgi:hypothetical protein